MGNSLWQGASDVRLHGLRHTFGSQMAMSEADPFAIMKAMGHADIKTTMIYVSLGKSHIREQVDPESPTERWVRIQENALQAANEPSPALRTVPRRTK
jgi:integrase